MSPAESKYLENTNDLEHLAGIALRLSAETQEREVNSWRLEYGSYIFTKICCHAVALLQLKPHIGEPDPNYDMAIWDMSSLAVLARAIIDSYYVFFYLAVDGCDEDESEFRYYLWNYHAEKQRIDLINKVNPESPETANLERQVEGLKENLVGNGFYQALETKLQRKIRKGEVAFSLSNTELSKRAGIHPVYYKSTFNFLSAYVHAYPFAATQLMAFRVDDDESIEVLTMIINYSIGYLCHVIRDFIRLFQINSPTLMTQRGY